MVAIPIELFALFIAVPIVLIGIGLFSRLGVMIAVGGIFLMLLGALTDVIIMGKIPKQSTTSGSTTTYVMVDNSFLFTQWHKIMMLLMGITLMLMSWGIKDR